MNYTILGRTGLTVSRSGFGALPIQRLTVDEAGYLLRKAYDGGINFYDTARLYTDSELKVGTAFKGMRNKIIIATKTAAATTERFWADLHQSLELLSTDYIDIYQFHNPREIALEGSELYNCMIEARQQGKIRFIGCTQHSLENAEKALESDLYDTIQYPLSALSDDKELDFASRCCERNIGVIGMKALCGGLLESAAPSMAVLRGFEQVVPIWGFQREEELNEVLGLEKDLPVLDGETKKYIKETKQKYAKSFCRGCGYCQPCPAEIEIQTCARMPMLLRRARWQDFTSAEGQEKMKRIEECTGCGSCIKRCPYELNPPELLRAALDDYRSFMDTRAEDKSTDWRHVYK